MAGCGPTAGWPARLASRGPRAPSAGRGGPTPGPPRGPATPRPPGPGGGLLAISQFTLLGDTRKGRRPGFDQAADPATAQRLFEQFVEALRKTTDLTVETGVFGARMKVELVNDGPVTFVLDSRVEPDAV